ncbi:uncharacterized protein EDB91DRAFT_1085257 [Suillus paluster]|uniref:uncharacterized protein n=1 Tax=Suillus paluster TaxID=48578 RepID=UPI001B86C8C2|nr:uncharacterized protein EDB91DRAFT_1085257 [Suillus paluster]KAG1730964.1 hypothetical protein EDB91DRAFT_1085257 [Suillus paluster]
MFGISGVVPWTFALLCVCLTLLKMEGEGRAPLYCYQTWGCRINGGTSLNSYALVLAKLRILFHPVFGDFVKDCGDLKPTHEDYRFVREFSYEMCKFHADYRLRTQTFREVVDSISYGIPLYAGDYHLVIGKFVSVVAAGRNEIGDVGAEPFLPEAMCCYRKSLAKSNNPQDKITQLRSVLPCLRIHYLRDSSSYFRSSQNCHQQFGGDRLVHKALSQVIIEQKYFDDGSESESERREVHSMTIDNARD